MGGRDGVTSSSFEAWSDFRIHSWDTADTQFGPIARVSQGPVVGRIGTYWNPETTGWILVGSMGSELVFFLPSTISTVWPSFWVLKFVTASWSNDRLWWLSNNCSFCSQTWMPRIWIKEVCRWSVNLSLNNSVDDTHHEKIMAPWKSIGAEAKVYKKKNIQKGSIVRIEWGNVSVLPVDASWCAMSRWRITVILHAKLSQIWIVNGYHHKTETTSYRSLINW